MALTKDSTRVMNRIKSVYRSWAIPCAGTSVYSRGHRGEWLDKLVEPGVRIRAEHLYQQLDSLEPVRQAARRELLRESRKHAAVKLLRQIPAIGPAATRESCVSGEVPYSASVRTRADARWSAFESGSGAEVPVFLTLPVHASNEDIRIRADVHYHSSSRV